MSWSKKHNRDTNCEVHEHLMADGSCCCKASREAYLKKNKELESKRVDGYSCQTPKKGHPEWFGNGGRMKAKTDLLIPADEETQRSWCKCAGFKMPKDKYYRKALLFGIAHIGVNCGWDGKTSIKVWWEKELAKIRASF